MGVLQRLDAATPHRRQHTVCLDSAIELEHQRLKARLLKAAEDERESFDQDRVREIANRIERLREQAQASEVTFTFERLGWSQRFEIQQDHAPRNGNMFDDRLGYNVVTYPLALIRACTVSITDADGDTVTAKQIPETTWHHLLGGPADGGDPDDEDTVWEAGALNADQIDDLFGAAKAANDSSVAPPLSALALLKTPGTDESSKSPGAGADRHPSDSPDGSPSGSPTSSETTPGESFA